MTDCRGYSGTCCTGVGSDPCTCTDKEVEMEKPGRFDASPDPGLPAPGAVAGLVATNWGDFVQIAPGMWHDLLPEDEG